MMIMRNWAIFLAAILFGIIAIGHLIRLFFPFAVVIGIYSVPESYSLAGFLVAGMLSAFLLKAGLDS